MALFQIEMKYSRLYGETFAEKIIKIESIFGGSESKDQLSNELS